MVRVQHKKDGGLLIQYEGDNSYGGTGSQVPWGSERLMASLREAFGCKEEERITGIEINQQGVKAYFERGTKKT